MKVIISVLMLLATPLQAEVYKTVTADGEVIYSDVRTSGSKQLNVPEPQTYTPPPLPVQVFAQPEEALETKVYSNFVIDSPLADDTIRDSLGNVELLLTLEPDLVAKDGHRIEYYLDDEPQGRRTVDMAKTYVNVPRGEHKLSAAVVDKKGQVIISTQTITVFLKRESSRHPNSLQNPDNPNSPKHPDNRLNPANLQTTIPLRTLPPLNTGN